jgi:ABC-type antimicrobial peptide transport system permease subunit
VRLTFTGLALGVVAAVGLRGVVSTLLFGVTPSDRVSYLLAAVVLGAVALVVAALPARRASRVDPTTALRYE